MGSSSEAVHHGAPLTGHPPLPLRRYAPTGQFVHWQDLAARANASGARCLEFESAVAVAGGWLWNSVPLPAYRSPLADFAEEVAAALGLRDVRPDPCRPSLLFAARDAKGSAAVNRARCALGILAVC